MLWILILENYFKVKVEFEDDAPITKENVNKLAAIIHGFCEHEELPELDQGAMAKIVEYSSKTCW